MNKPILVGDIGINHQGNIEMAAWMAKSFGKSLDYIKLQTRVPSICVPQKQRGVLRESLWESGKQIDYMTYKNKMEFSTADLTWFGKEMKAAGIKWFTSAWDIPSLEAATEADLPFIKIPSVLCKNVEMSDAVERLGVAKKVLVSLGDCADIYEMEETYYNLWENATPFYCLPVYGNDVFLPDEAIQFIDLMKANRTAVGYSTHSGRILDLEFAILLGYKMLEFHITFDKGMRGTDHSSSLNLRQVEELRHNIDTFDLRLLETREPIMDAIKAKMDTLRPDRVQ